MKYFGCLVFSLLVVSCSTTSRNTQSRDDGGAAGAPDMTDAGGLLSSGGVGNTPTGTQTNVNTAGSSSGGSDSAVTSGGAGGSAGTGGLDGSGGMSGTTNTSGTAGTGGGGTGGGGTGGGGTGGGGTGGGGTGGGGTGGAGTGGTGGPTPLLPDGETCEQDAECDNGHCVDGYCCNSDCAGQCESCGESGSEGTCSVRSGQPLAPRAACAGGLCGGECDGVDRSACTYPDDSTVCSEASCSAGVVTTASVCNGSGACTEPGSADCSGSLCADDGSAACNTSCTPTSCASNQYCDATGACVAKLGNGNSCSSEAQCSSGNCVDGICCNDACDGQCESCAESGSVGTCQVRTGAPLATRPACDGSGPCRSQCDGEDGDACTYPGSELVCAEATCSAGMYTPESTCNGSGTCPTQSASQCAGNRCLGGECADCTQSSCTGSTYCSGSGACVDKKGNDSSCDSDVECDSDNCSVYSGDGTCCSASQISCADGCTDQNTDEDNCGSCDNACGHDRTCTSGSCTCNGYTLPSSCGGCGSWTFETASTEGWVVDTENPEPLFTGDWNGVNNVVQSQSQEHGGSYSLAASFLTDFDTGQVSVMIPFCTASGGDMNIGGFTLSFWAYYTGTGELTLYSYLWVDAWGDTEDVSLPALFGVYQFPKNTWVQADVTFTQPMDAHHLAIRLGVDTNFTGTLYLDDIQLTGP